jgi:hypothetical protein
MCIAAKGVSAADASRNVSSKEMCIAAKGVIAAAASRSVAAKEIGAERSALKVRPEIKPIHH